MKSERRNWQFVGTCYRCCNMSSPILWLLCTKATVSVDVYMKCLIAFLFKRRQTLGCQRVGVFICLVLFSKQSVMIGLILGLLAHPPHDFHYCSSLVSLLTDFRRCRAQNDLMLTQSLKRILDGDTGTDHICVSLSYACHQVFYNGKFHLAFLVSSVSHRLILQLTTSHHG